MKKMFVCSTLRYPHGSPAAQRFHYIARACQDYGLLPYVITNGDNNPDEYQEQFKCYSHNGILYNNVDARKGNLHDLLNRAKQTIQKINEFGCSKGDILYIYTTIPFYGDELIKFANKKGMITVGDKTEWHIPSQYKLKGFDPTYILDTIYFKLVMNKLDKVIVISHKLEGYFKAEGKETLCVPVLTDVKDYPFKERDYKGEINIIYPGRPVGKDDFSTMISALALLPDKIKRRIRFHLTSLTEKELMAYVKPETYEKIKDIFIFHGWMEYSDLLDLYCSMNFTLIVKPHNLVSESNFPSKVPELMACGVIPVITDIGDIVNYLDEKNSIFIKGFSKKAVIHAMKKAADLNEAELKSMSEASRECAATKFDYSRWINPIGDFITGKN